MSCRSILFSNHGAKGTIYRTGEHLLVDGITSSSHHQVILAIDFFSICSHGIYYAYVKGKLFSTSSAIHTHSSNAIVTPTSNSIAIPTGNILRKVMLYPETATLGCSSASYVVIDFQRNTLPIQSKDVIVPVYPVHGANSWR